MSYVERCLCGRIVLNGGSRETTARNWRPDCLEHGVGTAWYEQGGKAYFEARRAYTVELQRRAAEARRTGSPGVAPLPPHGRAL